MDEPAAHFTRHHVDELDGLRALLALWVVACHMLTMCGFMDWAPPHFHTLWMEFIRGGPAVETFMILSGFAISFLLAGRRQSYGQFLIGRFFRIYPVYAVCLALGVAVSFLQPAITGTAAWRNTGFFVFVRENHAAEASAFGSHLLAHGTLLNGLVPHSSLPFATTTFLPPGWSITLEWQYYLVAPLVAVLARSVVGIAALLLISWYGYYHGIAWANPDWAFLPARLPMFLVGIASHSLYMRWVRAGKPSSRWKLAAIFAALALAPLAGWHRYALMIWAFIFGSLFFNGDGIVCGGVGLLRRALLGTWIQAAGRMSYSIYLLHWPIIVALLYVGLAIRPGISADEMAVALFVLGVPLILMGSTLLHRFVELPGMVLGKKLAGKV